jgi:uncharacterized protein YndB with AHSA1/START domain
MEENKPIGLTKDVGFQFGVRRTLNCNLEKVWDYLLSKPGLEIWLGEIDPSALVLNEPFTVPGEAKCMITVLKPNSHLRMKWQPLICENFTTLQLRVIPAGDGCTISMHTEQLDNEHHREKMKTHWTKVLNQLVATLDNC